MTNLFLLTMFSFMASTVAFGDANIEEAIIGKWEGDGRFCGEVRLKKRREERRTFEFHRDGKLDVEMSYIENSAEGRHVVEVRHHWEGTYSFDNNGHLVSTMTKITTYKMESWMSDPVVTEYTFKNLLIDKTDVRIEGDKLSGTFVSGGSSTLIAKICGEGVPLHLVYLRM